MKHTLPGVILTLLALHCCFGQEANTILRNDAVFPVRTINSHDEDYSDLAFLKEILKDKRIVLLGEQSHGDGATFEAKVRLIKFLHQEMGFSMVSFESAFYENYKAFQLVKTDNATSSPLNESVFDMWSDTKEFESFSKYVHNKINSNHPLIVSGFDFQEGGDFTEQYLNDLRDLKTDLTETDLIILEQVMIGGVEFITGNKDDSIAFFKTVDKSLKAMDHILAKEKSIHGQMMQQTLISWVAGIQYGLDMLLEKDIKVQNPRDLQMAQNLIFLSNLYPDKKIICWGASYHFSNQIGLVEITEVTKEMVHKVDSIEKSPEPTDIAKNLDGAIPMGKILKEHFGNALYSLSFSSYEGSFGKVGSHTSSLAPVRPPAGSIEDALVTKNIEVAIVNYGGGDRKFYSSALGNLPILAPWQKIFDGLFFIKTSYPPSFPESKSALKNKKSGVSTTVAYTSSPARRVIDAKTGNGISFAAISLVNSPKGVAANAEGEFVFNPPSTNSKDQIVVSSMGYENAVMNIGEFNLKKEIILTPKAYELEEVIVTSKPLTAKEIIRKAEKAIEKNYYQSPHGLELFYRVRGYQEDSITFNEEASVLVFDPDGYKTRGNATRNIKGEILQFRNATSNSTKDAWSGVGGLWLMYSHDIVLDKSNVLHRTSFYTLTLDGITTFDNKRVYEISFECDRPGAFTTGYGYPAPISATGKIFIDVSSYAILKFEMLVQRKSFTSKRQPHITTNSRGIKLVQTYKQFDGKYFLNYSKQIMFATITDTRINKHYRKLSINELMATEIITKPPGILTIPLGRIKSMLPATDPDFWNEHNFAVEDHVDEIYRSVGIK